MVCTAVRAESQMLDMYILETGNKMQSKILTKCRFKKNIYIKKPQHHPQGSDGLLHCIPGRGLDPKIKVISPFKNKKVF